MTGAVGADSGAPPPDDAKVRVLALYIPLADHYAALVAFERYHDQMQYADFQIEQMPNWDLLRAKFRSGQAEMAFVMGPLAMDMFLERPSFRWVGLMHRDGNALAVNDLLNAGLDLPERRKDRTPDGGVARVLKEARAARGEPTLIGVPHLLSTHSVVLYRYLKEHDATLTLESRVDADARAITVAPPESPAFIRGRSNRALPAAFEQSLPWADVVETGNFGHVAWYSKDVMPWPEGHVECIALATDAAIADKFAAVNEVMAAIHRAGRDIEAARIAGGDALEQIVSIVRSHIPLHNRAAIIASLDPGLDVINYRHLDVDKAGLRQVMDWAVEGGIIRAPIDIDAFADLRFGSETFRTFHGSAAPRPGRPDRD